MKEIDEIISRMIDAVGVKNQTELAKMLAGKGKTSSGMVSQWRKRGGVPRGALAKVSEISGISIAELKGEIVADPKEGYGEESGEELKEYICHSLPFLTRIQLSEIAEIISGMVSLNMRKNRGND